MQKANEICIKKRNAWIIYIYCILFWLWGVNSTFAQQYNFKQYSVAEGMPHSRVSIIHQDKEGYMWFGTMGGGLARFDGNSFKTYTRSSGLRDNVINAFLEDSKGRLWLSTDQGGVGILKNESLQYQFEQAPLDTAAVYTIKESPDGRLWFATYGAGVFIYDGESLNQLTVDDGLSSNYIWDFNFRPDGSVWIGTHNGLTIYNEPSASESQKFTTITNTERIGGYAIYDIYQGSEGVLWLATNNGITNYDNEKFEVKATIDNTSLGYTYAISEDKFGNIWIGTAENGLFRQFGGNSFRRVSTENGLSSNNILTLYTDSEDNMWVGSSENGVDLYERNGDAFIRYNGGTSLNNWSILSVKYTTDNRLLVGTEGMGLWEIKDDAHGYSAQKIGLNKEIWVVEELANGHLLLLTGDNIIYEYDGENLVNFNKKIGLVPIPYTIDLFVDSNNNVWIGTDAGVYHTANDSLKLLNKEKGLIDNFVWEINEFDKTIWISTENGISRYSNNSFDNISSKDGLVHDVSSTIIEDDTDNLWIGTSGGISYLQNSIKDSLIVENFDIDRGLKFVDIQLLLYDQQDRLLQGTNAGLQMLDVNTYLETDNLKVTHFSLGSNGNNVEFAHKAVDQDSSGIFWMGTTSGLLRYDPKKFRSDTTGPPTEITSMQINFQDVFRLNETSGSSKINYVENGKAQLEFNQNNVTFTFSALEYENPEELQYRYKLKGFDDQWNIARAEFAVFTNLPAEDYQFEVQAKNKFGYWGDSASLAFVIEPPFWNTYWFYGAVFTLMAGLVFVFIKSSVNYLEKRRLKELVNEKTEDLQSALDEKVVLIKEIHHRVKNNLAVISGLIELQLGKTESELAENVLKESQRRVLAISMIHEKLYQNERLSEIDFEKYIIELIDIITYSFSHIEKNIEVETCIKEQVHLTIDESIPCGLIINELVSNAYEHAFTGKESGKIKVLVNVEEKNVILQVSDNGVGCEAYQNIDRDTLGLTLIKSLAMQLEGELDMNSSDLGTMVSIKFQSTNESYRY